MTDMDGGRTEWRNFGDADFPAWGGWLVAGDPEVPHACIGLWLGTPDTVPGLGEGQYCLLEAWVDLDRWDEGRADVDRDLAVLRDAYDVDVMGTYAETVRALGERETAFLLLDSGLEDANRDWLGGAPFAAVGADAVRERMAALGAGRYAPGTREGGRDQACDD